VRGSACAAVILVAGVCLAASLDPAAAARLQRYEQAIAADPENLVVAGEYRQLAIATEQFDRAIDFLEKLADRRASGPNIKISLAFAYVDKVPIAGDIRRLYLGRDAMSALTKSIAQRPCVLAFYMRGLINLYYNRFIFKRADRGVADLSHALSIAPPDTPPKLLALIYVALGDGYFRLEQLSKARDTWSAGLAKFPGDARFVERLQKQGEPLADVVTTNLTAGRRVDTSLVDVLPIR
jgi:tetratricopeptide (TPR) repeat protein